MPPFSSTRRAMLGMATTTLGWFGVRDAAALSHTSATNASSFDQDVTASQCGIGQLASDVALLADRQQRRGISLLAFGFKGDGVTDDTSAWRQAIAFAGTHRIRNILVPAGLSLVRDPIVDAANPLPAGLTFTGEGAALDGPYAVQSRLKYVGKGVCWEVAYPTGAPATAGRWAWDALTFECADAAGTMFSFGDPLHHQPDDNPARDPHRFIQGVAFRGILAFGGRGTGDFLRGCKTFEIVVDADSAVYNFRRAFWLKGCDNCEIRSRMVGNNRAVMIEKAGTFGNNNRVNVHYVGGVDRPFGGEIPYSIWDDGRNTTIEKGMLLEGTGPKAHLYLGGYGTNIHAPVLGARAPFFELAPDAREIVLYSPRCPIVDPANAPILHPPSNPNLGGPLSDHRIRIVDAPQSIQAILPDHPRILLFDLSGKPGRDARDVATLHLGTHGLQPRSHVCSALNYWGRQDSPGGGGIKGFVQDPAAGSQWVIQLTRADPVEQGIVLDFKVGTDIQPGIYRLVNRMRLASGADNKGWALIVVYDGNLLANDFTFATASTYVTHNDRLDLSEVQFGKTVSIHLYNLSAGKAGTDLFVEAIGLYPALDKGWVAGAGTPNQGAFSTYAGQDIRRAFDPAQVQTIDRALQAASQRIVALEQALRRQGIVD